MTTKTMIDKRIGSSLDDFFKDEGTLEAMEALAVQEVRAWQRAGTTVRLKPGPTDDGT